MLSVLITIKLKLNQTKFTANKHPFFLVNSPVPRLMWVLGDKLPLPYSRNRMTRQQKVKVTPSHQNTTFPLGNLRLGSLDNPPHNLIVFILPLCG